MWGGAIGLVERRVIRRGWATTAILVFVLALSAGAAMAAVAGGRRAATSYDRFLAWTGGAQVSFPGGASGTSAEADANFERVAALPQVEASHRTVLMADRVGFRGAMLPFLSILPVVIDLDDPASGRYKLLEGRRADPDAVGDALVGFETADRLGLRVGDTLDVYVNPPESDPTIPALEERVTLVGIAAFPGAFPTVTGQPTPVLGLTPAFRRAHEDRVNWTNGDVQLTLRDGTVAGVDAFRVAVQEAGIPFDHISSIYDDAVGVRKLMRVEAGVLWLMAAVISGAAIVVLMQLLRREASVAGADLRVLRSLGLSRSAVAAGGALHGGRVGALGAAGAVGVAVAVSPLLPRGVARTADPAAGFHADLVVLGFGAAVTVLITIAVGAGVALLAVRAAPLRAPRPPAFGAVTARLRPAPAAGVRLALGSAATGPAASLRIGLVGLATIVAALIAIVSMQASFDGVLDRPELSGSTWDMTAHYDEDGQAAAAVPAIAADPAVQSYTRGGWGAIAVNGRRVLAVHVEPSTAVTVATDRGRAPIGPDEIALGSVELDALGVSIGDTVEVAVPDDDGATSTTTVTARITGRAILAAPIYEALGPGEGGAVTVGLMRRIVGDELGANSFFIKLRDHSSVRDASAALADRISPSFWFARADRSGVRSLRDIRQLPYVLVGLLGVMAAAALVHRIATTSRSEQRQLAVLRSLGFTDRQLAHTGATQGSVVSVLAMMGAVPLGLFAAVLGWRRVADYLAVVPEPVAPALAVVVVVVGVTMMGVAVGLAVGRRSRRRAISVLLRTE